MTDQDEVFCHAGYGALEIRQNLVSDMVSSKLT